MSQELAAVKTGGQIAAEAFNAALIATRGQVPDGDLWEAAADAVAAPLRARIAELEAERDRLADALNDNPDPLVSSLQSQVEHFRDLTAEILAEFERATRFDRTPSDEARLAEWRAGAGLETS